MQCQAANVNAWDGWLKRQHCIAIGLGCFVLGLPLLWDGDGREGGGGISGSREVEAHGRGVRMQGRRRRACLCGAKMLGEGLKGDRLLQCTAAGRRGEGGGVGVGNEKLWGRAVA